MTDLLPWMTARRAEVDALLARQLDAIKADGDPGRLIESVRYSLLSPGKRLRPLLALAAAEAVAGEADESMRLGCVSIELVHCYSLIHDDLPAMDDDDFRRGRPSNHKVFGEATAILAGDALLTLAFEWIAVAGARAQRPGDFLRAALALAQGAGISGMVRGQARDLGEAARRRSAISSGYTTKRRRPCSARRWRSGAPWRGPMTDSSARCRSLASATELHFSTPTILTMQIM